MLHINTGGHEAGEYLRSRDADPYQSPTEYANLNELRAPGPIENPSEGHIYRHHSLEERVRRASRASALPTETIPTLDEERVHPPRTSDVAGAIRASRWQTELFTVSYLVVFSFLGTLARLGLQSLTQYPGAPVTFGILWANFAGTAVLGFLTESAQLLHDRHAGDVKSLSSRRGTPRESGIMLDSIPPTDAESGGESSESDDAPAAAPPTPFFIGLASGFCGSFTSFSSFMLDAFLAMTNALPAPAYHTGEEDPSLISRGVGWDFLALLATTLLTVCMCLSGLKLGGHAAIVLSGVRIGSGRLALVRSLLDKTIAFVAVGFWVVAVLLCAYPPGDSGTPSGGRSPLVFALVLAPLGCLLRFYVSLKLNGVFPSFPLGTFTVNMLGTAVLGMSWDLQHLPQSNGAVPALIGCQALQGIMDGFCGCLTTVSTLGAELSGLRRQHAYIYGLVSFGTALALLVTIMGTAKWAAGWEDASCIS